MHDLCFYYLRHITPPDPNENVFRSKEAKKIIRAFASNALRAISLAALPGFSFVLGHGWAIASQHKDAEETLFDLMNEPAKDVTATMNWGTSCFEGIVRDCGIEGRDIVEAALRSVLVGAWSSAEVLLKDLSQSAETAGKFSAFTKSDYVKRPGRPNPIKPGYTSLEKIRAAYEIRFNDADINTLLEHEAFSSLALLRHVIMHNAGIADSEFIGRINESPRWLVKQADPHTEDKPVELNGIEIYEMVEHVFKECYRLIGLVDAKL